MLNWAVRRVWLVLGMLVAAICVMGSPIRAQEDAGALQISDVPVSTQRGPGSGRYEPPVPANPSLPTLWLIGDSTVRNGSRGDNGPDGQWGWGAPIVAYFDLTRINVVNRALGGTSSRSFYRGELWGNLRPLIKKGDFVVIQFGHNDTGRPEGVYPNGRAPLSGTADDTREVETTPGTMETVHSFGWYLRQFVQEIRAQGATPILCSLTPRKRWTNDGKFEHGSRFATWTAEVAAATGTLFVPLNDIAAARYEALGQQKVETFFVPVPKESLHTGWDGAVVNAQCVVSGLKALAGDPLGPYFSTRAASIAPWTGASPATVNTQVTVVETSVQAPATQADVPRATKPTIFVVGDSTGRNNAKGAMGWGDALSAYFDLDKVNVVNRAMAGRSSRTFVAEGRWDKVVAEIKPGDIVLIQFGHNDGGKPDDKKGRASLGGLGEQTQDVTRKDGSIETVHTFGWYLRKMVADTRGRGATPILLSLTVRDIWRDGKIERGNGRFGQWSAEVAKAQGVQFVDATNLIADQYEQMGQQETKKMFGPDYVHTSPAGAAMNAWCIAQGLKELPGHPVADYLKADLPRPAVP